ncbi:hypothetical protein ASZ90_001768 [hydrocarbon metagenome]|uniref:Uncharacterized protein n=1 Tax=hydrocarbon metagenome TaxID=938273 RepID=A0A0W8G5K0_9ZZZZ
MVALPRPDMAGMRPTGRGAAIPAARFSSLIDNPAASLGQEKGRGRAHGPAPAWIGKKSADQNGRQ